MNRITVTRENITMRPCERCGTTTAHIGEQGDTCLQCVVDGDYSADRFKEYNRWAEPTTSQSWDGVHGGPK